MFANSSDIQHLLQMSFQNQHVIFESPIRQNEKSKQENNHVRTQICKSRTNPAASQFKLSSVKITIQYFFMLSLQVFCMLTFITNIQEGVISNKSIDLQFLQTSLLILYVPCNIIHSN